MPDIHNKKVVITGGAQGIGLATVKRLIKENCAITIWDFDQQALAAAELELKNMGAEVYSHVCDITDESRVNELAAKAVNEMGQVDILINNAGCVIAGRFCSHPPAVWERETKINLTAMYYTIYAFLPAMLARNSGHVVNISSGAGLTGLPDLAVYCATKWAVYGLTESLRLEAMHERKFGVRFSSIHPGILKHGMFEGTRMNFLGELFVPRLDSHDQIAEVIVEKALKRGKAMVMRPQGAQVGMILRGLFPDILLNWMLLLSGAGGCMDHWTGRPGSKHASN